MTGFPFPLTGSTLIVGPSQAGKTRLTARALEAWVDRHGTDDLVVLEFAPELERDGRILGGRLDRFTTIPDGVWHGVLDAHAPRAEGADESEAIALAKDNAERGIEILDAAPDPNAVFVNDATIPLQHAAVEADKLTGYCDRATRAVLNAFDSDELGTDDPVSRRERAALTELRSWADRTVELD
ncbi:hypothetical protein J2751_002831 [Halorubrum alkaliphilum]|uniref:Uncharacterized protein n=1 Tax=Halorubrum alkaliphilum TaxID=261290 RepID=A0A8T4GHR2_9EURY|nr:hypothetical protein [Halorubrum alkaliphilum]MBP1923786.1 hypothetical protein [Halorubrum alkaliphilum]